MKKWINLFLLVFLMLVLTACGGSNDQATIGELTQTDGDLKAVLSFSPDPPGMMSAVQMTLTLTDSSGKPVEGAQVSYDLTMPAMPMPTNKPEATDQGNGVYLTTATFTMAGEWQAAATIIVNGETSEFSFDFKVD